MPAPAQSTRGVFAPLGALGIRKSQARRVQRWLEAAAAELPGYRWVESKSLAELLGRRRYRRCVADPDCLLARGRQVGAAVVVSGDVGAIGNACVLYLRAISKEGAPPRSISGVLDPKSGRRRAVRELLFQLLLPERYSGALQIDVDVKDAWIYLDGRRVARGAKARLDSVAVGPHAVRVTHPSYRDFVRFVDVAFQKRARVEARLSPFPVHAKEMRLVARDQPLTSTELPWYRRWWAVAAFGAVVVAGTTTAVALIPRSVGRDREVTVTP
jgi:hypothetical protein